jgi:uncharacterized membrane protein YkvA (DUF1232 family)
MSISSRVHTLKDYAKKLKSELMALYYAYRDSQTKIFPKILILITLGYALSPIDLIPDFIPILGYLDDLILIPALISLSIRLIPEEILNRARIRAKEEPITLKKNWFVALLFILLWTVIIIKIVLEIAG